MRYRVGASVKHGVEVGNRPQASRLTYYDVVDKRVHIRSKLAVSRHVPQRVEIRIWAAAFLKAVKVEMG